MTAFSALLQTLVTFDPLIVWSTNAVRAREPRAARAAPRACPDRTAATGIRKFSVNSSDRPIVKKTKPTPNVRDLSTCAVGEGHGGEATEASRGP